MATSYLLQYQLKFISPLWLTIFMNLILCAIVEQGKSILLSVQNKVIPCEPSNYVFILTIFEFFVAEKQEKASASISKIFSKS